MTLGWDLCRPYSRDKRPFEQELCSLWFQTREAFDSVNDVMVPQLQTRPNLAVGVQERIVVGR